MKFYQTSMGRNEKGQEVFTKIEEIPVPEELVCKFCKHTFAVPTILVGGLCKKCKENYEP